VLSTITAIGGAIYDYRVALTIIGGLLVAAVGFIWFMGPDRVRAWVRRQFK
jgi:cytochrome c biogenesis protein CcdA